MYTRIYMYIPLFHVDVVSIGGTVHSRLHHSRPWPTLPLMQARKFLTSPHSHRHCYMHLEYSHTQILLQYITIHVLWYQRVYYSISQYMYCGTRGCATADRAVSAWLGLISAVCWSCDSHVIVMCCQRVCNCRQGCFGLVGPHQCSMLVM